MVSEMQFTDQEKLHEIEKEISRRRYFYKRMVTAGKMKMDDARRQILLMKEIASDYQSRIKGEFFWGQKGE